MRPHRRQPTRLPCPWDSPGKNTAVGCHFLRLFSYKEAESVRGRRKQGSFGFLLAGPWSTGVLILRGRILVTHEASLFAYIQGPLRLSTCFHPAVYARHLCLQKSFPWKHVGHAWNPPFRVSCRDSLMLVTFATFRVLKMCLFGPRSWKAFSLGMFFSGYGGGLSRASGFHSCWTSQPSALLTRKPAVCFFGCFSNTFDLRTPRGLGVPTSAPLKIRVTFDLPQS